jgi:hypothetical protein
MGRRAKPAEKEIEMDLFVIRRCNAWKNADELKATAKRSADVGNNDMPADVRWIRSYVVTEADGSLGTVCIYQGSSPEKIREHAKRAGMPADEIVRVADTVFVRPDPQAQKQAEPA